MTIPIQNIYFLLCYAWDLLEPDKTVDVQMDGALSLADLYARLLTTGLNEILRRGVERQYVEHDEVIPGVRERILLAPTLRQHLLARGRTHCSFTLLDHDVLVNQILKAGLRTLLASPELGKNMREEARRLTQRLAGVSNLDLTPRAFRCVQLHHNQRNYRWLLNVCRLILETAVPSPASRGYRFPDFTRDEKVMDVLFQRFVFNFLRREQSSYVVRSLRLHWRFAGEPEHLSRLPHMQTDVVLRSPTRTIVIDTKYYREPFAGRFQRKKIRAQHLYQIRTYMRSLEQKFGERVDGMLLYAAAEEEFDLHFYEESRRTLRVTSLNLNQPWQGVAQALRELVA